MRMTAIVVAVLATGAALGWWLYQQATAADRLLAQALRGEITGSEQALANQHQQLKAKAAASIGAIEADNHQARAGLARLLSGVRHYELAQRSGTAVQSRIRRMLAEPDPEITTPLVALYRAEVEASGNLDERLRYERLLAIAMSAGACDFRTVEEFARRAWEQSPEAAREPLTVAIGDLLSVASTAAAEARREDSGWHGIHDAERERLQSEMRAILDRWALPTLRAAADARGVPAEAAPRVRHMVRAYGLALEDL